jgi:hypothetical protein
MLRACLKVKRSRLEAAYRAIRKLAPVSHAAHSNVRSSMQGPLGSMSVNLIGLPHVRHGSDVV